MIKMDRRMFEEMTAGEAPVLVEFQAPWCGYCRRLAPVMERMERELEGKLAMASVNIDREEALADAEHIELVPTLVLYRGGKALGSLVAPSSGAQIRELIENTLGGV